jgi:hypothetical protein
MSTMVKVVGGFLEVEVEGLPSPQPPQPGYPSHPWVPPWGPSHPIAPGGRPPGFWGGIAPPYPDQGLPGQPPGFWGGVAPPWLDNTLPGQPPGIWPSPGHPAHPIAPGGRPPGFWGGGNVPMPSPPIFIPPNAPPVDPPEDISRVEWKSGWTADKGWVTVGIVTPEMPVPTPSS